MARTGAPAPQRAAFGNDAAGQKQFDQVNSMSKSSGLGSLAYNLEYNKGGGPFQAARDYNTANPVAPVKIPEPRQPVFPPENPWAPTIPEPRQPVFTPEGPSARPIVPTPRKPVLGGDAWTNGISNPGPVRK